MIRRALLLTLLALAGSLAGSLAAPLAAQESQGEFFGLDKIWDIHIELARADWVAMFPSRSRSATRLFGKYPYRTGAVKIGEHSLKNVSVRMKGNATFMANGGTMKKSLKLDFNRVDGKQKFLGMGKLNLQCNALDGTQIKEAVSYAVYRACGVGAGRTSFARVQLTLRGENGSVPRAYLGLYTVVEQVDQRFLQRVFGSRGLILKPDGETLGWFGPKWNEDYERAYHPKSKVQPQLAKALIETAARFDEPTDAAFAEGLEAVFDIETFLRYSAATAILINSDSPLTVPDNHYLVVPARTRKLTIVPWDMNWSMGEYGRVTRTPTVDLSVTRPTEKEVFWRVLENPQFAKRYRAIVAKFIEGPCSAKAMQAAIRTAHATVKDALAAEAKRIALVTAAPQELGGRKVRHPMLQLREDDDFAALLRFAAAREKSVLAQLAGEAKGRPARNVWGPNARTVRGAWVRGLITFDASKSFDRDGVAAAAKASFPALDADGSGALSKDELVAALRERWRKEPRRPANRLDPSADRARIVMRNLDADGNAAVTMAEWQEGVGRWMRFWDRDADGSWSRAELQLK